MKNSGFTLIELLVAIAVLGVLSGIVIAALNPASFFARGRDGRRLSDLAATQAALETYFAENDSYPATGGVPFGSVWESGGITYLKSVPNDPSGSPATYEYCADATQDNYVVCATMETTPLPSDCVSPAYGCSKNCCLTNPF